MKQMKLLRVVAIIEIDVFKIEVRGRIKSWAVCYFVARSLFPKTRNTLQVILLDIGIRVQVNELLLRCLLLPPSGPGFCGWQVHVGVQVSLKQGLEENE
jgi:hypothetical protein